MNSTYGFVGCGTIGSMLVKSMLKARLIKKEQVIVYDALPDKSIQIKEDEGVSVAPSLDKLCAEADTIFISVKPQDIPSLLEKMGPLLQKEQLIISVAAGVTTGYFNQALGENIRVIRIMPNTPCLVNEGMMALCGGKKALARDLEKVKSLIEPLGKVVIVPERLMDAVTGLSGSGPAFVYLFIEALADGGVEAGLSRDMANLLAAQTVLGAARMVLETEKVPAELKNMVTSPAGTTSCGLLTLEEKGVRASIINAVKKSAERARELSK